MKVFQSIQKNFKALGISSNQATNPFNKNNIRCFFLFGFNIIVCLIFLFHSAKSFTEYTESIYMASAVTTIGIVFICLVLKAKKLFKLIDGIEKHINDPTIYIDTIRLIEKLGEMLNLVIMKITPPCWILPKTISSYFQYMTTNLGNESFELPNPMWLPFNWKNPFGFFIAVIFQYATAKYLYFAIISNALTFGIGLCLFVCTSLKHIKSLLRIIHETLQNEENDSNVWQQMINFMQYHSKIRQIWFDVEEIYQLITLVVFIFSIIGICGSMLMIQIGMSHHEIYSVMLIVLIFEFCYSFILVFVACEFGENVSYAFNEINDIISQLNWYLFPTKIQRILPTIINFAQQPVDFRCFGSIACNRNHFKKMLNVAYKYFMVLRQFIK